MANDVPSEIQALVLGVIFIFIGHSILTIPMSTGTTITFVHNIGWAFIIGGVISLAAGIWSVIQHFR